MGERQGDDKLNQMCHGMLRNAGASGVTRTAPHEFPPCPPYNGNFRTLQPTIPCRFCNCKLCNSPEPGLHSAAVACIP